MEVKYRVKVEIVEKNISIYSKMQTPGTRKSEKRSSIGPGADQTWPSGGMVHHMVYASVFHTVNAHTFHAVHGTTSTIHMHFLHVSRGIQWTTSAREGRACMACGDWVDPCANTYVEVCGDLCRVHGLFDTVLTQPGHLFRCGLNI